jgi:hypothetical protein
MYLWLVRYNLAMTQMDNMAFVSLWFPLVLQNEYLYQNGNSVPPFERRRDRGMPSSHIDVFQTGLYTSTPS